MTTNLATNPAVGGIPVKDKRKRSISAAVPGRCAASKSLREAYGERTADLCHTFETKDGPELQHAALVDGQLKTIPALVRLAMAQVVARSHDMTDDQRQMAWSSLGKRWMDCFPDVPSVPAMLGTGARGPQVDSLLADYRFLRQLESRTRWIAGRGVEELESESESMAGVVELVEPGLAVPALLERIGATRKRVRRAYAAVVAANTIAALEGPDGER